MVFTHQLTVGTFDGGRIIRRLHAQHITGIFQRRATLRLLPVTTARLLLITAAKLCTALHHAQKLVKLGAGDP
ncbi:Uncharacterised protein [Shigella sonnei]|nr:Uncharacterised protein [Shigella sonnei]